MRPILYPSNQCVSPQRLTGVHFKEQIETKKEGKPNVISKSSIQMWKWKLHWPGKAHFETFVRLFLLQVHTSNLIMPPQKP